MVCLVRDFQIQTTRAVWIDVPEHLRQAVIDAFKSNRSAMQGAPVGASPSLSVDAFSGRVQGHWKQKCVEEKV